MFLSHMHAEHLAFDGVADINPMKQGKFLPVSGMEILSPLEALRRGIRTFIVVNPIYLDEIRRMCGEMGADVTLIPLDGSADIQEWVV